MKQTRTAVVFREENILHWWTLSYPYIVAILNVISKKTLRPYYFFEVKECHRKYIKRSMTIGLVDIHVQFVFFSPCPAATHFPVWIEMKLKPVVAECPDNILTVVLSLILVPFPHPSSRCRFPHCVRLQTSCPFIFSN
jgi:hypothetical protein